MAKHKIEGLLVKFDEPRYNGTIITPEAFKSSDGAHVPVSAHDGMIGSALEDLIEHAELEWRPDGIYYVAYLNPETDAAKVNKQLREVNLKIIDLENKIRNAEGELHDFKDKKIQLEALLNEIQEETKSESSPAKDMPFKVTSISDPTRDANSADIIVTTGAEVNTLKAKRQE